MSGTNTWSTPSDNGRYYYQCTDRQHHHYQQLQPQTPSISTPTESSPISPQQLVDWFGNSSAEQPYMGHQAYGSHGAYVEEPEEVDYEIEQDQEEDVEAQSTKREASEAEDSETASPAPKSKRRRRTGEDGDRKIRSSRACLVCRKFKAKCMPGPSGREPDEDSPCSRCSAMGHSCEFTVSLRGKYPTKKFARLQKQVEHMEHINRLLDEALRARYRSRSRPHYTHYLI
ncbi:Fungal Zn(2)-Cys(6) binuclear cluster domain [Ceratobasidium sp. AG-Ba]|nr:Fungal Zn(2)-Cys(6) binuclear cluster domain [Ceratobasidium sp. AG-Ba]